MFVYLWIIMPPLRPREISGYYTHRGYYTLDGRVPENTLEAFQRSIDHGYGIELDVQLSKDGEVYVFHDDDLKRLFGKDIKFSDLMSWEIDELRLKGSIIPKFRQVLKIVDKQVPLIVELKEGGDYKLLSSKVTAILEDYDGEFVVQSFDPKIVLWFRLNKKSYSRGLLIMKAKEYDLDKLAHLWVNMFFNFLIRPDFVTVEKDLLPVRFNLWLYKKLDGKLVSWTIHESDPNYKHIDGVIFEHYQPKI